jgi:hypothetical protein
MSAVAIDPGYPMTEEPVSYASSNPEPKPEPHVDFAQALKQNLSLVSIHKGEWTARLQAKEFTLEVKSEDEQMIQVPTENYTSPQRKLDWHPIFRQMQANTTLIDKERRLVCAKGPADGLYLVSNAKAPTLWAKLLELREQRREIAYEIFSMWDDVIIPGIKERFEKEYGKFVKRLPKACDIASKYDLTFDFIPITPIGAEDFNLDDLNPEDRMKVIEESNSKISQKTNLLVDNVMQDIFGEVLDLCEQINEGSLETGKKREESLEKMLTTLERLKNFSVFASPEVLEQSEAATNKLKSIKSVDQLNGDPNLQKAIKAAFQPLGEAVKALQQSARPTSARAARGIAV